MKTNGKELEKRQKLLEKLQHAVEKARRLWRNDSNIISIGIGSKHQDGKVTEELAIVFHVHKKLRSETAIHTIGSRTIPSEFEGFPTDVKVFDAVSSGGATGNRDETRYDPLVGGVATSNAENNIVWFNGYGTLGTLCFLNDSPMALSNWHVWADGGDKGDDIIQPGHPRGSEHLEGLAKVAFCGPLLGSLFEWEAPSPLTWGLYGGAAAAAIAAAASDEIDPMRRGQNATPTDPGELTLEEQVDIVIDYLDQPIPGTPYKLKTVWEYQRTTDKKIHTHEVKEELVNPHYLTLKRLWSDQGKYRPGSKIRLYALVASPHSRPCQSYYVVAHSIPDSNPSKLVSTVLSPVSCDSLPLIDDGEDKMKCVDFSPEKPSTLFPHVIQREDVRFEVPAQLKEGNRIVDFSGDGAGELFLHNELIAYIPLSTTVEATVFFNHSGLTMDAYYQGHLVDSAQVSGKTGRTMKLLTKSRAIDRIVLKGGQWESSLLRLCYTPITIKKGPSGELNLLVQGKKKGMYICCYTGELVVSPSEQPSTWKNYLMVQNINDVPGGVPPEEAATTIGGLIVSQNMEAQLAGCGAVMAADHLFDII
ncbi:MAG: hypothetical protein ACFFFC_04045 [Candidatus Thorarchaeota archaeon]